MNAFAKQHLKTILTQLGHVLPGQAPLRNFVHCNPLQGYQHLPFTEALAKASELTGINGYLPEAEFREFFQSGRIDENDLSAALKEHFDSQIDTPILPINERVIIQADVYRLALLYEFDPILPNQLAWQIEELGALEKFQADLPQPVRLALLNERNPEPLLVAGLWQTLLAKLELEQASLHPENMLDLSLDQAEALLAQHKASIKKISLKKSSMHEQMRDAIQHAVTQDLQRLGNDLSLRSLIMALCGVDILDNVRAQIIRICSSALDEGVAAWPLPGRNELGMYAAWRNLESYDINPFLQELPDWQAILAECPEDAEAAIILQLNHFEIPEAQWQGYLQRLVLEIPGWSGMIHWRERHPGYSTGNNAKPTLADYLAIRLTLDRLWLNQVCRDTWQIEAKLSGLRTYFRKNSSEYMVRSHLFRGDLPEYLIEKAEAMITNVGSERYDRSDWQQLADMIWTWQSSLMTNSRPSHSVAAPGIAFPPLSLKASVYGSGWRLFRLCQHLGLTRQDLQNVDKIQLEQLLNVLDRFTAAHRRQVWLDAYEYHYRKDLLQALRLNHQQGRWITRTTRPEAQVIFCMDEREEGIRRHLEELRPNLETFGAAGYFGIAMAYKELNDSVATAYCPVSVTPKATISEVPKAESIDHLKHNNQQAALTRKLETLQHHSLRRNLILSSLLMGIMAPFVIVEFFAKVFFPKTQQQSRAKLHNRWFPPPATELNFTANDIHSPSAPPGLGFSNREQAELVESFLRNIGLSNALSRLIVLMGHASLSRNNAHFAAYACDACSGHPSGVNARAFAAMANRPEIRELLARNAFVIPQDAWFIGAEHNTGAETITWFDLETLPEQFRAELATLQADFEAACRLSAHERCRRMASAPRQPNPEQAIKHVRERVGDFSEVRPESGHATHAAALIGRRSMSRGLFLDRRAFLVSYDPCQDKHGIILENILLEVVPIIANINLEYYFSTINNQCFGSGSKVLHNVISGIGVMEGSGSDLRTGLPVQLTEIHEAMRLQIVIETPIAVLEQIYVRQPRLQAFIANRWALLSCKDPDTGEIFTDAPGRDFQRLPEETVKLPAFSNSAAYYQGQRAALPIALISASNNGESPLAEFAVRSIQNLPGT